MRSPAYWSAALLAITQFTSALPQLAAVELNELFGRAASCNGGQQCGYSSQLCCVSGGCYTDANNQAQCSTYYTPGVAAAATGGYYVTATTTYTAQGPYLVTSTYTTYVAGSTPTTTAVAVCNAGLNQQSCGNICCGSNQYCSTVISGAGSCAAYTAGSSGYAMTYTSIMYATTDSAGVPLRPTASTLVVVTVTSAASTTAVTGTTEPFQTPIATGANVTITSAQATSSGGLSGGAIAGIVIGVLIALFILGLICFCCCLKGLVDGCLAIFGLGRKRERKEVDIYERRTHHSSGGGAVGRTWYGAPRPARQERQNSELKTLFGIGAGLTTLWAILGLKRRNERRKNEEKQSEYSYYSSDYYTSESSASSDRRTRDDRRPRR